MARDAMVRAVAPVAQDRMTRPLSTFPRSSPERRRRDEEERRQRVMVITLAYAREWGISQKRSLGGIIAPSPFEVTGGWRSALLRPP